MRVYIDGGFDQDSKDKFIGYMEVIEAWEEKDRVTRSLVVDRNGDLHIVFLYDSNKGYISGLELGFNLTAAPK